MLLGFIAIFYIYQKRWLKENFEAFVFDNKILNKFMASEPKADDR